MFLILLMVSVLLLHRGRVVSGGPDSSAPENPDLCEWASWGHRCGVLGFHFGVPDCGGSRAGWERKQGFEGEENHTQASAAGY